MNALAGGEDAFRDALRRLAEMDPRISQVVQLRLSDKLTDERIAARLEVPVRTVKREWPMATAWPYKELS